MPLIRVQLSVPLDRAKQTALLQRLSATVAAVLGKPEGYMMVILEPEIPMLLGGAPDPAAFVEVRSVGTITGPQASSLSERVGAVVSEATGIRGDRIYGNFAGVPGSMWGHDGGTFG